MMDDTAPTKGELLAAINRDRETWEAVLAEVGENRMLEPGPMGDWTFKDLVAHLTAWRARTLQRLEAAANGQPDPDPVWPADRKSDDQINAWIHEVNQDRLLGEILGESRESYARFAEVVQMLPDEALSDPSRFPWLEGDAIGPSIAGGGLLAHWRDEHEPDVRRWLKEKA